MIQLPDGAWLAPEWKELADKVVNGDGLQWTGDPDLWLGLGVINQGAKEVARRLEVWRHCEDGTDQLIGSWHPGEAFRVCYDLARMRVERPGGPTALDEIDAANEALEAEQNRRMTETLADAAEYMAKLWHDTHEPRNVFRQVGGRRDDEKQAPTVD